MLTQPNQSEIGPTGIRRRGLMLVLSSPSGAGKSTIARALLDQMPGLEMSVSVTTRPARPGEVDGEHYHFISEDDYHGLVAEDGLLEHALVFSNYYGTPRKKVEEALGQGRDILFDIDWQGTQQLRERSRSDLVSIFILPPSVEELERRLHSRAQDSAEVVQRRMDKALDEISHWSEYDYVIHNVDLDTAIAQAKAILSAERLRRDRQVGLSAFVGQMRER